MKISEQVEKLEETNKELRTLCGIILATINVNRLRKTLTSIDENHFDQIIEGWENKYKELTNFYGGAEKTSEQ